MLVKHNRTEVRSPQNKSTSKCFNQIVEMAPTAQSYVLLGDAYMAIQEPERALEIYEQALRRNPKDSHLRAKMGQVKEKS
jgi:tetratricopeptide repeat protein 21B